MNVLTKLAFGMMEQLRPGPAKGDLATSISLPPPAKHGDLPLMERWLDGTHRVTSRAPHIAMVSAHPLATRVLSEV